MKINSFKELAVWQQAHQAALLIFALTENFPHHQKYVLSKELHRTAISVTNNIAEGMGRRSTPELIQYLVVSRGSLEELRNLVQISGDLKYIPATEFSTLQSKLTKVSILLNKFIAALRQRQKSNK